MRGTVCTYSEVRELLHIDNKVIGKNLTNYSSELVHEIIKIEPSNSKVIILNGIDKYECQINELVHQGFRRKFILIDDLSTELLQSEKEAYGRIIRLMLIRDILQNHQSEFSLKTDQNNWTHFKCCFSINKNNTNC